MLPNDADKSELAERLAAELREGRPPPKRVPMLPRWRKLVGAVNVANVEHTLDPQHPRHKIGRFDAVILRGRGGYGIVFEVFDPELQRRVALKLCRVRDDATAVDMLAEARALAQVKHPNVVTVHETGRYEEDVFFVMDLATGKTAHHFAREHSSWPEIVDIYLGAGAGLFAAHQAGITHGDFKPTNVLLDEGGAWPRVADFGLARIRLAHAPEHERDEVRVRAGTLGFAAPEVLRGQAPDALSDQWSFCAALWHSLEGVLPFVAESTDQMLETIEQRQPWTIGAEVPEQLRDVLRRGLAIEPAERFPDLAALLRALELVRQTAESPRVGAAQHEQRRPPRRRRRGPRGWGLFVVSLLACVGAIVAVIASRAPVTAPEQVLAVAPEPASPCALAADESPAQIDLAVAAVCARIREGKIQRAVEAWELEYSARLNEISLEQTSSTSDESGEASHKLTQLALDTLIIARTFAEQAELLELQLSGLTLGAPQLSEVRAQLRDAAIEANEWASRAASKLGTEHAGVKDVQARALEVFKAHAGVNDGDSFPTLD